MPLPPAGCTVASLIRQAGIDSLEARILACHALGLTRAQLITRADDTLNEAQAQAVDSLLHRRAAGEPVAYILGEREFYGLSLRVTSDVLIPRPETELLVELAAERLPSQGHALDLGTGSGAIAIALAHLRPDAAVTATDVSEAALAVARGNAERHRAGIALIRSDWYRELEGERFELIVSNPPYIVDNDPHLSQGDLRFEPIDALTDHGDGLSAIRAIAGGAPARLATGGWLLMEHGYDQAAAVRAVVAECGFEDVQSWKDLAGIERVSGGRLKG